MTQSTGSTSPTHGNRGAVDWVLECSPYRGADLLLHLILARDVERSGSDVLAISPGALAETARCSRSTTCAFVWKAASDGRLEVVDDMRGKVDQGTRRQNIASTFRFVWDQEAAR